MKKTGTTRTPVFWDTPSAPWLPILVIHIRCQVKTRQSQSYKFWKIAKYSNFEILQEIILATHLLKLLDNMNKYEMDPTRTVDTTERTPGAEQTDGRTDERTDGRAEWNHYTPPPPPPPPTTSLCGGYNDWIWLFIHVQFWPPGIVVACVCPCVYSSVCV